MLFKNMKLREYEKGYKDGLKEAREQERRHSNTVLLYHPVIHIPNEWSNPVIGFVDRVEYDTECKCIALAINDAITGTPRLVLGDVLVFSEQKLIALSKLDPFERWALHAFHAVGCNDFEKAKSDTALMGNDLMQAVMASSFLPEWLAYRKLHLKET